MESRRFRERLDTLGARRDDESTGTDVPPDAPAPFGVGGAEEAHGSSRTRRHQNYRNRVPPARQANSELLCSLESSMSSRRSARTHSARFPANGRSEFRRSWGGAVGGNGNGGTPDRGHLRRYAITDEAMLKDAGEQRRAGDSARAREGKWLRHSRARSPSLAVDRDGAGGGNRTHTGVKPTGF